MVIRDLFVQLQCWGWGLRRGQSAVPPSHPMSAITSVWAGLELALGEQSIVRRQGFPCPQQRNSFAHRLVERSFALLLLQFVTVVPVQSLQRGA